MQAYTVNAVFMYNRWLLKGSKPLVLVSKFLPQKRSEVTFELPLWTFEGYKVIKYQPLQVPFPVTS